MLVIAEDELSEGTEWDGAEGPQEVGDGWGGSNWAGWSLGIRGGGGGIDWRLD